MTYIPSKVEDKNAEGFYQSRQKMFDYVLDRIYEQGEQSVDPEEGGCAYVGRTKEDGFVCHCAVGWLLPDRIYELLMKEGADDRSHPRYVNGLGIAELFAVFEQPDYPDLPFDRNDMKFLNSLQGSHDAAIMYTSGDTFRYQYIHNMECDAADYYLDRSGVEYYKAKLEITPI